MGDEPEVGHPLAGRLLQATPILPARDVEAGAASYRENLGFRIVQVEKGHGVSRC
ncbi:MAG: hypothetical protein OEM67_13295 [Thermoleophilia bacterium]|nr:hypothetical protein [Thermoleophilia bacterium]MDH3724234.1 hypothetical protein [Thermoleophilia bacterium]